MQHSSDIARSPSEPLWIRAAKKGIGQKEIAGSEHNSWIVNLWKKIRRGGIKDDETPWCAAFVGAVLEEVGIESTRFESARSYLNWGKPVSWPVYGAIVVFDREGAGGHVGFLVGSDGKNKLMILGGNQNNEVNISAFSPRRVLSMRWPTGIAIPDKRPLQVYQDVAETTTEV